MRLIQLWFPTLQYSFNFLSCLWYRIIFSSLIRISIESQRLKTAQISFASGDVDTHILEIIMKKRHFENRLEVCRDETRNKLDLWNKIKVRKLEERAVWLRFFDKECAWKFIDIKSEFFSFQSETREAVNVMKITSFFIFLIFKAYFQTNFCDLKIKNYVENLKFINLVHLKFFHKRLHSDFNDLLATLYQAISTIIKVDMSLFLIYNTSTWW